MNETSLSDDLSIRTLTLTVRQQAYLIGHLSERVTALEKAASSPQDTLNRRLKALDEKANAGGLTCDESDERTWLVKRINLMPPTVGNAYTSPEGWEAKQKAVEANQADRLSGKIDAVVREIDKLDVRITALEGAKFLITTSSGYDELGEAHKYLDTLGVPRSEHPNARLCLQGRIDWLRHAPQISEDAKIGKAWREDSSLEKWFPFSAAELKNANEAISDAHRCLNTYQIPAASCLRDRIEHLRFAKLPKWRDAKSDPPTKPGHYIVHFVGAGRTTTLDFDGYYWVYCDTKTPLANPFIVALWQELPPPPQATEKA